MKSKLEMNLAWNCWHGMHADHVISMLKTVQDVSCSLLIGAHQSRVTVQSAPSSGYPPLFSSRLMGPGEMIAALNSMWSFGHITLITQSLAEPQELFGYGPTKNGQIRRSPILTSTVPSPWKTPQLTQLGVLRVSGGRGKGLLYPFGTWTKMTVPVRSHSGNSWSIQVPALRLGPRVTGCKSLGRALIVVLCSFCANSDQFYIVL